MPGSGQCSANDVQSSRQLLIGRDLRNEDADDVAVHAAPAPSTNSTACMKPSPRTSRIMACREFDVRRVARNLERCMGEPFELPAHGLHHAGMIMPQVKHPDTTEKVQVVTAFDVPDQRALPAFEHDRVRADDPTRHVLVPLIQYADSCAALLSHHRKPKLR